MKMSEKKQLKDEQLKKVSGGVTIGQNRIVECEVCHSQFDPDTVEIIYHFDKDLCLRNLRIIVPKDTKIPSISPIYMAAFLAENEAEDLFKVHFEGLKIDYKSTLYYDGYDDKHTLKMPYCRCSIVSSIDGVSKNSTTINATSKKEEKS